MGCYSHNLEGSSIQKDVLGALSLWYTHRHTHTDLYGGFRQPGHSNEEFLLQFETSEMNQQEGDEQADH